jgi:hypothetical protein
VVPVGTPRCADTHRSGILPPRWRKPIDFKSVPEVKLELHDDSKGLCRTPRAYVQNRHVAAAEPANIPSGAATSEQRWSTTHVPNRGSRGIRSPADTL